ncbi:MAG TPA: CPBP family intramembrane glutamic endopeptidase [Acidimicrobiales bacterium]|nr:CPBP family intramembrane glutamic endopeptidase [Acidimicrobiales bacterium]
MADSRAVHDVARRGLAGANPYGLGWALGGLAVGYCLAAIANAAYLAASGHHGSGGLGDELVRLIGLWAGLVGAAVAAMWSRPVPDRRGRAPRLAEEFGLSIRLWPDVPVGIACGVGAQYLLAPLLEVPLLPFVPHLFRRLGAPARTLVTGVHGPGLVVLGVFLCVLTPLVEELYFRGLLLRSLIGVGAPRLGGAAVSCAVVVVGLVFGLAHFEALQFLALAGFGVLLGAIAARTGRLGTGIFAHAAFNAVAFLSVAVVHI